MKEIAQAILSAELKDPALWFEDEHYAALQHHVFRGGIWDADFRDKIGRIREKPIRTLSADGVQSSWVQTEQELNKATDTLLCAGEAKEGSIRDFGFAASWQYHIGGEPDET